MKQKDSNRFQVEQSDAAMLRERHRAWQEEQELDAAEGPLDYLAHRNRRRVQQFRQKLYRKGRDHDQGSE